MLLAAAGALLVPPLDEPPEEPAVEPLDELPVEPDDEEFDVVEPEDDESDEPDLPVLLDVLSEPEERESVR
ncbi:hypothetical protein [Micromonospora radicis]|uniref:hypothetical protein n=1 Tax=Micromonospora radicis TaxID=1894971 RepID=UPI001F2179B0|nr:hypothetical protein [Micromonospora radicis]